MHHVISNNSLDALAVTETWTASDAPRAIKCDVAQRTRLRSRSSSSLHSIWKVWRWDGRHLSPKLKATASEFELLVVRLSSRSSSIIACFCRPLFQAMSTTVSTVLVCDIRTQCSLKQWVGQQIHDADNLLDLIITTDGNLERGLAVNRVCVSLIDDLSRSLSIFRLIGQWQSSMLFDTTVVSTSFWSDLRYCKFFEFESASTVDSRAVLTALIPRAEHRYYRRRSDNIRSSEGFFSRIKICATLNRFGKQPKVSDNKAGKSCDDWRNVRQHNLPNDVGMTSNGGHLNCSNDAPRIFNADAVELWQFRAVIPVVNWQRRRQRRQCRCIEAPIVLEKFAEGRQDTRDPLRCKAQPTRSSRVSRFLLFLPWTQIQFKIRML